MRAAVVTRFGGPEVFELAELPDPVPGPGQVAIDVAYAAVGLIDIYIRQGLYKDRAGLPQPPYVPGLEVAGTIRALGEGVEGFQVAEPVVTLSGTGAEGGYASVTVVDAAMTVSLDRTGIGPAAAVAAMLLVGNASGDWPHTVATNDLWFGSLAVAGVNAGYYFLAHPEHAQPAARGAVNAISQGLVDITTRVFPLTEAAEAHRRAENGSAGGRILLAP